MKSIFKKIPIVGPVIQKAYHLVRPNRPFPGSESYWKRRYRSGGNSGDGSYNQLAEFKAEVINGWVCLNGIGSVIEFGCGDGNQLALATYPKYMGLDVSPEAIALCKKKFHADRSKVFGLVTDYAGQQADLALSLDVIFHLVEDMVFESYMARLFDASRRLVIIYSSNTDNNPVDQAPHVRHRKFSDWVDENRADWHMIKYIPNRFPFTGNTKTGSLSDFFIYSRTPTTDKTAAQTA